MDSDSRSSNEVAFEIPEFVRVFKGGRVERLKGTEVVPASFDPVTGVSSKDVVIDADKGVSARLYLPPLSPEDKGDEQQREKKKKLPVLIYIHGGAFIIETPFSPLYHGYLNSIVARARVVTVSVHYRRAPEHPLPVAYEDSWAVLQWAAANSAAGTEPWLAEHGDFTRLFLAGDSAGGNIVHNLTLRAAAEGLAGGVEILGIVLTHPYFWGMTPVGSERADPEWRAGIEGIWRLACPSAAKGVEDSAINPTAEGAPSLAGLGCRRVLVCVAERDFLRERGWHYYKALQESGWPGMAEILVSEGEDHVFHLFNPACGAAAVKMEQVVAFLNRGPTGLELKGSQIY